MTESDQSIHPGEFLREKVLKALGVKINDAATELGVNRVTLSKLLNCKAGVSTEMAMKLEEWLYDVTGARAEDWLRMQAEYDLMAARKESHSPVNAISSTTWIGFSGQNKKVDKTEIMTRRIVAGRLKDAREALNINPHEASKSLGISPKQLLEIEAGKNLDIPLSLLKSASPLYMVDVDYLFGLYNEYIDGEKQKNDIVRLSTISINKQFQQEAARDLAHKAKITSKINKISLKFLDLVEKTRNINCIIAGLRRDNRNPENLKGFISLQLAANDAAIACDQYVAILRRYGVVKK